MTKFEPLSSGSGIQVVTPGDEHTFVLDEDALSAVLLRPEVRDRPVVVISVAGAFRKGKSFLLDFFLRYMHHKYNLIDASGEWLGKEEEPLTGFEWRGGAERHTTGLLIWSQPFLATLDTGEKVVILLMDTQGTFDSESTVKDCATIFALSTMLSSVQIYNLSQNIEEDDLQHLQLFSEYGRLAQQSSGGKPFQTLQLLVRDWSYPYEYSYGASGGRRLLDRRLEIHDGQHPELQTLRRHITSCFESLQCFLMPHPGLHVATSPHFNGQLNEISPEFKESLKQLVPMLLSPANLVPKTIEGQKVKAKDLVLYFKAYMNIFNGTELPEPKSILEATAEANNLSAVSEAHEVYDTVMEAVCGGTRPYLDPLRLREEHSRARDKALHSFYSKRKMGGDEVAGRYCEQLVKDLEEKFEQLSQHNESKNLFRVCATPAVFLLISVVGYLVSLLADAVGFQTGSAIGQTVSMCSLVLLAIWVYSRVSGNMRDIALQLDDVANNIRAAIIKPLSQDIYQQMSPVPSMSEQKKQR